MSDNNWYPVGPDHWLNASPEHITIDPSRANTPVEHRVTVDFNSRGPRNTVRVALRRFAAHPEVGDWALMTDIDGLAWIGEVAFVLQDSQCAYLQLVKEHQ